MGEIACNITTSSNSSRFDGRETCNIFLISLLFSLLVLVFAQSLSLMHVNPPIDFHGSSIHNVKHVYLPDAPRPIVLPI